MKLDYKDTEYDVSYNITDNSDGLEEDDFWLDIHLRLKNNEIDYEGVFSGMSFHELIYWNSVNERFINDKMNKEEVVKFIKRIGELRYYPVKNIIKKDLFLFPDVEKYYTVYINKNEIKAIYNMNKEFISKVQND